jgi:ankyrin repeat protein
MNTRIIRTLCLFLVLTVFLTACNRNAGKSAPAEKTAHEKEFEDKIADLVQNNPDINKIEERGISILCWAVENNYVDSAKTLLQKGADPDITPMKGGAESVLFSTVKSLSYANDPLESQRMDKSKAIAELLIQHGANVNYSASKMKNTPLHQAALRGRTDLCELFIQNGAKVHAPDALDNTPLHEAARGGYWESAQILLENGARPKAADKLGETALSLAEKRQDETLNQDIRKETKMNYNPSSDYDRTIKVLMEHGAK